MQHIKNSLFEALQSVLPIAAIVLILSITFAPLSSGVLVLFIFGTKGELFAHMESDNISVYTFEDKKHLEIPFISPEESILGGHGGGDAGMISELYDYFGDNYNGYCAADINISVKNHLVGFAAEKSRHEDTVESVDKFFNDYNLVNN